MYSLYNILYNIFKDYILELFNFKNTSTGFLKLIYKSLLNNLLGRFGLNIIKPVTKLIKNENLDFLLVLLSCSCSYFFPYS